MKTKLMIILFLIAGLAVQAAPKKDKAGPFPGWNKLDVHAKKIWKNNDVEELELMVLTDVPVKKAQKKIFKSLGFKYRSIIPHKEGGSIVTGTIPKKNLQCLASAEFVKVIEAALPLSQKGHLEGKK